MFFFVKDRTGGGDVKIQYEPTGTIWCDILTKPKQGSVFKKFQGYLINIRKECDDEIERLLTHPNLLPTGDICSVLFAQISHPKTKNNNMNQ